MTHSRSQRWKRTICEQLVVSDLGPGLASPKPVLSHFITEPTETQMPALTGDPQPPTVPCSRSLASRNKAGEVKSFSS